MAKIEIYTTPFCGYCARAKGLLDDKGAAYDEMDVMMDDKKRTEMRERAKRTTRAADLHQRSAYRRLRRTRGPRAGRQARRAARPAGLRSRPMATTFKAGLIQTNVSNEMAENVAFVREQTRLARDAGADFIMTPENTGLIGANRTETLEKAQTEETPRHAGGLPRRRRARRAPGSCWAASMSVSRARSRSATAPT